MGSSESRDVYIRLRTGAGKTLTIGPVAGDPSWGALLMEGQQEPVPVMSRGVCIEHATGDEQAIEWSQDFNDDDLCDGTSDDLKNMLAHAGDYASDPTVCPGGRVWLLAVDLTIIDPTKAPRTTTLRRTTAKLQFAGGSPKNKWTISGSGFGVVHA